MRVYINEPYVKRRSWVGKWVSLAGLIILGVGLFVSLRDPRLFYVSFITLILGFLLSNVGLYYANRYLRVDRPDAVLAQALKGFDDRYALYQFLLPVSQVLLEPSGLTVFLLKPQEGQILYDDGRWRNKQGLMRLLRWVGQESLGNPVKEVENEIQTLQEWLQKQAPDLQVPIRGAVVLTNPRASVVVNNPPVPVFIPKQIKGWLRKAGKQPALPQETRDRLAEVLGAVTGDGE